MLNICIVIGYELLLRSEILQRVDKWNIEYAPTLGM